MERRPLNILHLLSYPYFTGPAEPVLALAAAQRAAGHCVGLACDTVRAGDLRERSRAYGVPLDQRFALSSKSGPILLMRDVLAFKRLWQEGSLDILHSHRSHDHTLAALARPRGGRTCLVRTLHTERALGERRNWQIRRADGLITVAECFRDQLITRGVVPENRILAIEGAVDATRFCPGPGGDTIRAEAGVPLDAVAALIVARMKPDRGHRLLLKAWAEVSRRLPTARLMVAGRGELESALRNEVEHSDLRESVVLLGYRADLRLVYRACDLKVMLEPGNDGTCRAALEAMASGVAVLASDRGALREIVRSGRTGSVVPANDEGALSAALIELLSNRERLETMGREARGEAQRRFTIERQAVAIEEFYGQLLSGSAHGPR